MSAKPQTCSPPSELVRPSPAALPRHVSAPRAGWSADNIGGKPTADRQLARIAEDGVAFVELTTTPENLASQKVIRSNGGRFIERFHKSPAYGGGEAVRFRTDIDADR